MNTESIKLIKTIKERLNLSTPQLSQKLGYKSKAHVWQIERGYRKPSLLMYQRLVKIAREELNINITIDELIIENKH